jgi:hypothetical protein
MSITFTNKEDSRIIDVPAKNKIVASDVNALKDGINTNEAEIIVAKTAVATLLNDTNLVVAKETNLQAYAESADGALLIARSTGVSTTYTSTVSAGGTTFNQGAVSGEISSDEGYFRIVYAGATNITVTNLNAISTFVFIDKTGNLGQQSTEPTREDRTRKIFVMRIGVNTVSNTIIGFEYENNPIGHYANSIRDVYEFLLAQGVPFKKDQVVTGRAGDLGFDVSAGSLLEFGGTGDIYNPNIKNFNLVSNTSYNLLSRTTVVSSETNLVKFWDNNGTITALGSTTLVGHRLFRFSNGNFAIQYGQGNYANMSLAKTNAPLEEYVLNPALKDATFFGWWFIESTATNTGGTTLTDFKEYTLGASGGSSNSLSGALLKGNNLSDLLDAAAARTNIGLSTTVNQTDSTDKRFVTDAQETIIDDVSALTTGNIPYKSAGALLDSPISTDGTDITVSNNILISNNKFLISRNALDTDNIPLIGLDFVNQVKIDPNGFGTLITENATVGNDLTVSGELAVTGAATFASSVTTGGDFKLANNKFLKGRNAADTSDELLIGLDPNNKVKIDAGGLGTLIFNDLEVGDDLTVSGELAVTGAATFASSVSANGNSVVNGGSGGDVLSLNKSTGASLALSGSTGTTNKVLFVGSNSTNPDLNIYVGGAIRQTISSSGAATFASSVSATGLNIESDSGSSFVNISTESDANKSGLKLRQSSNFGFDLNYNDSTDDLGRGFYINTINNDVSSNAMFIDRSTGAASFASSVSLSSTTGRLFGGTTTGKIELLNSDSTSYMVINGSSNASPNVMAFIVDQGLSLTLNSDNSATFASSVNVGVTASYADNAAAISGGLSVGTIYRTGDNLKIVH